MVDDDADLDSAIEELDDSYLKVLLLLSVRRAQSEEPRRAGFWHALAVALAEEQEKRRGAAEFDKRAKATAVGTEPEELEAVLDELRREMEVVDTELRESVGDLDVAGDEFKRK